MVKRLLDDYGKASGQQVNTDKTTMVFSKNTLTNIREDLRGYWTNGVVQNYRRAFSNIKQRIWQKLQFCKERLISQRSKEVLLKDVALAIPTYAMSCFKFPNNLCSNLENLIVRVWWGQKENERKIHWVSWKKLCVSKF